MPSGASTPSGPFNTHGKQDEIALAQLGAALILAWSDLDPDLQRDLLITAENISGVPREMRIREIVDRLVREHDKSGRK
jgi:hypothetical protein